MKTVEDYRYSIINRKGHTPMGYGHISKEEAEKALAKSDKMGWGWSIVKHNDDEMAEFFWWNAWAHGEYGY
jgi:hypothetical protein